MQGPPAQDGSGRRTIDIFINSSWDVSPGVTNSVIYNAVQAARAAWNATSACGTTGYYLALNQAGGESNADIVVAKGNVAGGCAENILTLVGGQNSKDTITLRASVANDQASANRVLTHEIGHSLGLANSVSTAGCSGFNSIMSLAAPLTTCVSDSYSLTATDVYRSNVNLNSPSSCQININTQQANLKSLLLPRHDGSCKAESRCILSSLDMCCMTLRLRSSFALC